MPDSYYLISQARTRMLMKYPFFGSLALFLQPREDRSTSTMRTEGFNLLYHDEFVQGLVNTGGVAMLMGALVHEIMHAVLQHIWRRGTRDRDLWNMACDYVVNQIVKEQEFQLPSGVFVSDRFKGMAADSVYNILLQELPPKLQEEAEKTSPSGQSGQGQPKQNKKPEGKLLDDHSMWGKNKSGQDESADANAEAATWKMRAAQAAQDALQRGHLPAGMIQIIENILYPKLDWKQALASFVQPTRSDYTFIPPDRRFDYVFLPEFGSEGLEEVVVAIDTSGSVWRFYRQFISEMVNIVYSYPEFKGYIAHCDASVQLFQELDPHNIPLQFKGSGGTNFRPLFQEIEKRHITPSLMVFLTDGDATLPKDPPHYPVLWVLTGENCPVPHFGNVAYMYLE
ncbi:MAG: VWA-like domain-containing protein [Desulfotomaculaceae bacterium]|nr:VWA-like domain-containing protein [Desulfotomaculaceae bacterium]